MSFLRGFVVIVYIVAFFVALWQVFSGWSIIQRVEPFAQAIVIFSLLVASCGVLISVFVYIDGYEIDRLIASTGSIEHDEEKREHEGKERENEKEEREYKKSQEEDLEIIRRERADQERKQS